MTEINRLNFNPTSVYNNNEPKAKAEAKAEENEQQPAQEQTQKSSVAPDDVLSFLQQSASVTRAAVVRTPQHTPVGAAAGEMLDALVGPTAAGIRENMQAQMLQMADEYRAANPGVDERMDGWMQALEEEIGALFA